MSDTLKRLFDGLAGIKEAVQAVAPGLKGVELAEGIKEVVDIKGKQGAAEFVQGLMSQSNSYVPYGAGQRSPDSHDHGREGMSR